jgi:hypothetical protein
MISLIFLFATTLHLVFGYAMKAEFLVIPIATLFTVTQLRQTMPGAPDFGDYLKNFVWAFITWLMSTSTD